MNTLTPQLADEFPAKLKDLPTIIVDTREQTPLPMTRLPVVRATLVTADYSILGAEGSFCIERKTLPDLVASVTVERERFERELARVRAHEFRRLLIIGSVEDIQQHRYRSRTKPSAVLASLAAFEARYVPVVFAPDAETAGRLVERWAAWFAYSIQSIATAMFPNKNGSTRVNEQSQILEPSEESSVCAPILID